ncbi:MAG: hypothetical protein JWP20_1548, partial [Roseomonas sp.]|nr:hypothetical protein [Roseomonas sp.]
MRLAAILANAARNRAYCFDIEKKILFREDLVWLIKP